MEQGERIHRCDAMPDIGVSVTFGHGFGAAEVEGWQLQLSREASEGDLEENHLLEEVGETMWSVCAEVRFCPYCGAHLPVAPSGIPDSREQGVDTSVSGAFALFDQENWSGRIR